MEKILQLLYCNSGPPLKRHMVHCIGTKYTMHVVAFAQAVDHTPFTIMTKQERLLIRDIIGLWQEFEMHLGFIATVKLLTDFRNRHG